MFIEIKSLEDEIEYINIFKITYITTKCGDDEVVVTEINFANGPDSYTTFTEEKIDSFMKRLNKEKKEAIKILSRFEIMDL